MSSVSTLTLGWIDHNVIQLLYICCLYKWEILEFDLIWFLFHFVWFSEKTETFLQADQEKARKQAKCMGFLEPPEFIYTQAGLSTVALIAEYWVTAFKVNDTHWWKQGLMDSFDCFVIVN